MPRSFPTIRGPWLLCVGLLCLLLPAAPTAAAAQLPPDDAWERFSTEHFVVHHPRALHLLARHAGERAERAHAKLSERFLPPPRAAIHLIVTDHADVSNGFASVAPFPRIVVHAVAPVGELPLGYFADWIDLVVVHELVHIFHLDHAGGGGQLLRTLSGRPAVTWPHFPNRALPRWLTEGLAVHFESALTGAGRVRGSWHRTLLRSAALGDALERIDQAGAADAPEWPGGERSYAYGSLFLSWMADRHGEASLGRFARAVGGQWVPFRIDAAARTAFGETLTEAWSEWLDEVREEAVRVRAELAASGPLTRGEPLTRGARQVRHPTYSGEGDLAWIRADGGSDLQLRVVPRAGGDEATFRVFGAPSLDWLPDGRILLAELHPEGPWRWRHDLVVLDPASGTRRRLTKGARLSAPAVEPGGTHAVAVREEGGTNQLVRVELATGRIEPLVPLDPATHWASPRVSPDGRTIAAVRWRRGGWSDLVLLEPDGTCRHALTRDRALDLDPVWSPDGRWILWTSDRSGIPQILAASFDPRTGRTGEPRFVTRVPDAAGPAAVAPRGDSIVVARLGARGWELERIAFEPEAWLPAGPAPGTPAEHSAADPVTDAVADPVRPGDPGVPGGGPCAAPGPVGAPGAIHAKGSGAPSSAPWSPAAAFRPRWIAPVLVPGTQSGGTEVTGVALGLRTGGVDPVERLAWEGWLALGERSRDTSWGIGAGFQRWGNPRIGLSMARTTGSGGRVRVRAGGGVEDTLFIAEIESAAGVVATWEHRRAGSRGALSLGGRWIGEERVLQDREGRVSPDFRLLRPSRSLLDLTLAAGWSTARRFPFSPGTQEGVAIELVGLERLDRGSVDSLRGRAGEDGSRRSVLLGIRAWEGFRIGSGRPHVLAFRGSAGAAAGPGAGAGSFDLGGAAGGEGLLPGIGLLPTLRTPFPLRGFPPGFRVGDRVWSASVEWRFPLLASHRGWRGLPVHVGAISGALFADAGDAWEVGAPGGGGSRPLVSSGGEVILRNALLWLPAEDLRAGLAVPLTPSGGPRLHLRGGWSF